MGVPEPVPVDYDVFHNKIVFGQILAFIASTIVLALLVASVIKARKNKTRLQYSLKRLTFVIVVSSFGILGCVYYWEKSKELQQAQREFNEQNLRYQKYDINEKPGHKVRITAPFYLGKFEVAQAQFESVMSNNPSPIRSATNPVEGVTWFEAVQFCTAISEFNGCYGARLPTEAEWEFAARAGTNTLYCSGNSKTDLSSVAWFGDNSGSSPHPVGEKIPNNWGLYDVHGNVWEWCSNYHCKYTSDSVVDPKGPSQGDERVLRGGSFSDDVGMCRSTFRIGNAPNATIDAPGFRVVIPAQHE